MNPSTKTEVPPRGTLVELVGGPCCGEKIKWPGEVVFADVTFDGARHTYQYEGKGKAIYPPMTSLRA